MENGESQDYALCASYCIMSLDQEHMEKLGLRTVQGRQTEGTHLLWLLPDHREAGTRISAVCQEHLWQLFRI